MAGYSEITEDIRQLRTQAREIHIKIMAKEKKLQVLEQMAIYNIAVGKIDRSENGKMCYDVGIKAFTELMAGEDQGTIQIMVQQINDIIRSAMGVDHRVSQEFRYG